MQNRPPTPDPIKRKLRQESGFGCCVCGIPIIQYHHIVPWEIDEHFRIEDMMCLCPNHHDEATKGAFIEKEQREYKANPFCVRKKYVSGLLKINHKIPFIKVGSCDFVGDGDFISVDGHSLLSLKIESGGLSLSVKLYDESGILKAEINDNEWISGDPKPWDIETSYQFLKIKHRNRDIGLEIDTKKLPINLLARFFYKKQKFEIKNQGIFFNGVIQNCTFQNISFVGIHFNADTDKKVLSLAHHPRLGEGHLVVGKSVEECLREWEKLNGGHN